MIVFQPTVFHMSVMTYTGRKAPDLDNRSCPSSMPNSLNRTELMRPYSLSSELTMPVTAATDRKCGR